MTRPSALSPAPAASPGVSDITAASGGVSPAPAVSAGMSDIAAASGGMADCTAAKVRRLARRVTQIYDEALAPHGLTVGQFGLLAGLRRREGIGVGALAERLAADASTVSRLLKPLQAAGFLVLDADIADRRAKRIRLTDAGAAKLRSAAHGWAAAQARVGTALGAGRLSALHFIIDDARSHL